MYSYNGTRYSSISSSEVPVYPNQYYVILCEDLTVVYLLATMSTNTDKL